VLAYPEPMRVHVHSAGRAGRDAWPSALSGGSRFVGLDSTGHMQENVALLAALTPPGAIVFAHSAGAVPVFLALRTNRLAARALILVEPALYDIARGDPAIESHIDAMSRARARSRNGDLFGYWQIVRPLMFGGPADPARWETEREVATRFEARQPPWGFGVKASAIAQVPTFVVTGGWNAEYEAIAAVLAEEGATCTQLRGNGHRPQDHPGFAEAVESFLTDSDSDAAPPQLALPRTD
jgi:pimeloyl-ACP methyl ester carboxylesterase